MSEPAISSEPHGFVLVVDDDPRVCDVIGDALETAGLTAICALSDRDALKELQRAADLACVVIDVNLGKGTTGFDVARYARQQRPQLPVIYISGDTTEASFRVHGVPGSLFREKPFTPTELLDDIRKLVGDNDG